MEVGVSRTELVVDALAVHRLTRLVTEDVITQPARAVVIRWAYRMWSGNPTALEGMSDVDVDDLPLNDDEAPKVADLIKCRWCTSVWIAGFVVVARRYCPRVWDPLGRALALSTVGTLAAGLER